MRKVARTADQNESRESKEAKVEDEAAEELQLSLADHQVAGAGDDQVDVCCLNDRQRPRKVTQNGLEMATQCGQLSLQRVQVSFVHFHC